VVVDNRLRDPNPGAEEYDLHFVPTGGNPLAVSVVQRKSKNYLLPYDFVST
jgi:hypothetical protein